MTLFGIMFKIPDHHIARITCEGLGEFRAFYKYGALWAAWIMPDATIELQCKEKAGVRRDEAVKRMNNE